LSELALNYIAINVRKMTMGSREGRGIGDRTHPGRFGSVIALDWFTVVHEECEPSASHVLEENTQLATGVDGNRTHQEPRERPLNSFEGRGTHQASGHPQTGKCKDQSSKIKIR